MPRYVSLQAFMNSAFFDCTSSLPSRISTFDFGFARRKYQATWQARSYGPGGQRNGARGIEIANFGGASLVQDNLIYDNANYGIYVHNAGTSGTPGTLSTESPTSA